MKILSGCSRWWNFDYYIQGSLKPLGKKIIEKMKTSNLEDNCEWNDKK